MCCLGIDEQKTHFTFCILQTKLTGLSLIPEAEMKVVNIHEAKTHLSRLVEMATQGETFIIARAGKPLVKVSALGSPDEGQEQRLGFMAGAIHVPDDFDRMGAGEIETLFGDDV